VVTVSDKITRYNLINYLRQICDTFSESADYFEEKEDETANEMLGYIPDILEIVQNYMNGSLELIE
jgi:hypothetical protein